MTDELAECANLIEIIFPALTRLHCDSPYVIRVVLLAVFAELLKSTLSETNTGSDVWEDDLLSKSKNENIAYHPQWDCLASKA
jgi:hypothetical protein